jgi:hypothetical protein
MTDITAGNQKMSAARLCPKCGVPWSSSIPSIQETPRSPMKCSACGWEGPKSELVVVPFSHQFSGDAEMAETLMKDLRNLLASTAAKNYGAFLLKWGFMDAPPQAAQLSRYLVAIAKAATNAILETRRAIVEEEARERAGS